MERMNKTILQRRLAGIVLAPIACGASAQWEPPEKATYSLVVQDSGNGNGICEPGEYMKMFVWCEYTPVIDQPTKYKFPDGSWHDGTIKGFYRSNISLTSLKNGETGMGGLIGWNPKFTKSGHPWYYKDGSWWDVEILGYPQMPPPWGSGQPDPSNPILLFGFTWNPAGNYAPREVTYQLDGIGADLFVVVPGLPQWVVNKPKITDPAPVTFQVVPAPGLAAFGLLLAGALARRRR
jgi:hypothetical protein